MNTQPSTAKSGTLPRVLTSAILIPAVWAAVWWGPNWLVAALSAAVAIIALLEFFAMGERLGFHPYRAWTSLLVIIVFAQQWSAAQQASATGLRDLFDRARSPHITLELVLFLFIMGVAVIVLGSRRALAEVFPSVAVSSAGLLAVVLPFSTVVRLHGVDKIGPQLLFFTLVLVWVGDTAAYFAGRSFGRMKMAVQLSPNKTWEGAAANLFGALLVGVIFGYWMDVPQYQMLAMAALGSIAGQTGDLFESAFKRSAGVKDSGSILPGHGGMLDRIDALILAAPTVWYYFDWFVMRRNG